MLRSRMFTPGFRLFFGLFGFLLVAAFVSGVSTELQVGNSIGDNISANGWVSILSGPLTIGWKGAVGNHLGYAVLLSGAVAAGFLALVLIAFRDADAEAVAEVAHADSVPLTRAPSGTNYAPIVVALALALIGVGWLVNTTYFYAGAVVLGLAALTWTVRAWAERATGDDEVNQQIYHRLIDPLRVPIGASLLIAFVVFGLSRLILAAPSKAASSVIFGGAAVLFFGGVLVVAFRPRLSRTVIVVLLAIGGLAVLAGGIYGIVKGERPVEHEGVDHGTGGVETPATGGTPGTTLPPGGAAPVHEGIAS